MSEMIFNWTNLLLLFIVLYILYTLWKPYFMSKKAEAVVDSYVHPTGVTDQDEAMSYYVRFMYRPQKAGKRYYCLSKRRFDFKDDAKAAFPKGSAVQIRYYEDDRKEMRAIVISDSTDIKKNILYSIGAVAGASALAIGYQLLVTQLK